MCDSRRQTLRAFRYRKTFGRSVDGGISTRFDADAPQTSRTANHYAMRFCAPMACTAFDDIENWNYTYPTSKGALPLRWTIPPCMASMALRLPLSFWAM